MTDPPDPDAIPLEELAGPLEELVEAVLDQVDDVALLDAARAEAWASDVLALAADIEAEDTLVPALRSVGGDAAATALAALGSLREGVPTMPWAGDAPEWVSVVGTSRCEGAWALTNGGAESLAFRFVDAADARHVLTVDIVPGPPDTLGEVMLGPGDLLAALQEDDADIASEAGGPGPLAGRVVAALSHTDRPRDSLVINGRLLLHRLAPLTSIEHVAPPAFVEDDLPEIPERHPEDDAHARDVLVRALGTTTTDALTADDAGEIDAVAAMVSPSDLAPMTPAERDAVLTLEWADWLGAVIGLVRRGPGAQVDGAALVDCINRCPEVDTTIPKADRPRIEWAFDVVVSSWPGLGIVEDGALTPRGAELLPAALMSAWS